MIRGAFFGLELAQRALAAQQRAVDVTGHNVANANSRGYSRQVVRMSASAPYTLPSVARPSQAGQVGTGVTLDEIRRVRDTFLDFQALGETQRLGRWASLRDSLQQVEVVFNEPSEAGLRTVLDQFWDAFSQLSLEPESTAVRELVLQRGAALGEGMSHVYAQLSALERNLDETVRAQLQEINALAGEIAAVNRQIMAVTGMGDQPNDLLDRRGVLIEELARLVDLQVQPGPANGVHLLVNGVSLVDPHGARRMVAAPLGTNPAYAEPRWESTGTAVDIRGGSLRALLDLRDQVIPGIRADLDAMTAVLVNEVNALHRAGFGLDGSTGYDFFDPASTAANLALDPAVASSPRRLAASTSGEPGDGSNALAIAGLRNQPLLGGASLDDYYRGVIAGVGVRAREALRMAENQDLLLRQIDHQRQAFSGVSLDEEMANLIRYQHAYNAAARLMTAMDEMLDTVIARMGLAGR